MKSLRQFDTGAELSMPARDQDDNVIDLDGTEVVTFLLESPGGRRKTLSASPDASLDVLVRMTERTDLDEFGTWRVQGRVIRGSSLDVRTQILLLEVEETLDLVPIVIYPRAARNLTRAHKPTLVLS